MVPYILRSFGSIATVARTANTPHIDVGNLWVYILLQGFENFASRKICTSHKGPMFSPEPWTGRLGGKLSWLLRHSDQPTRQRWVAESVAVKFCGVSAEDLQALVQGHSVASCCRHV